MYDAYEIQRSDLNKNQYPGFLCVCNLVLCFLKQVFGTTVLLQATLIRPICSKQYLLFSLIKHTLAQINPHKKRLNLTLQCSQENSVWEKKHNLPGNIKMLRAVQCWVWIGFRQCLLRASERKQTSLSNIIRHIYSRVQCKSKQSACRWSCLHQDLVR